MNELFSNIRLIDYFVIFETLKIDKNDDDKIIEMFKENNSNIKKRKSNQGFDIKYEYKTINVFPKIKSKKDTFSLKLDSIYTLLPKENAYFIQKKEKYFSMIFTNENGDHYFCFFLKNYYPNNIKDDVQIYLSKYICFFSTQPFFHSFKNLLIEIYNQSTINGIKCYKVENIINFLLNNILLPKYETTQILFCLNENIYSFNRSRFSDEVTFKILFSSISIRNIVMIIISILMNSVIVIFHSNKETIGPIIYSLFQLIFPFPSIYSIVCNLNPNNLEYLGSFSGAIFGIYSKHFNNLEQILNANNSNYVVLDVINNKLYIEKNEYLLQEKFPLSRIRKLIDDLSKIVDIHFPNNLKSNTQDNNNYYINYINNLKSDTNKINDISIRGLFFNFMLDFFENYDEKKHYILSDEESQNKTFDFEKFIEDSSKDIQPFLKYLRDQPIFDVFIQNINHIVDQKHKIEIKKISFKHQNLQIKINPEIREKSLIKEFESIYKIFITGLERKKNGKSLEYLFKNNIYHSISIKSPPLEILNYNQNNIFIDPLDENAIKNEKLNLNDYKIEFNLLDLNLDNQKGLITNIFNREYNEIIKNNSLKKNEPIKINEIINRISSETFSDKKYDPIIYEFNEMIKKYEKQLIGFYKFNCEPEELLNYKKYLKFNYQSNQQKEISINQNKKEYLSNLNSILNLINSQKNRISEKSEFLCNFGINIIQSISICDYCKKPNDIWDLRENLEYKKNLSVTKCKFCSQFFIPYFYIYEEQNSNKINSPSTPLQFYKITDINKVQFICFQQIKDIYHENYQNNSYNFSKFPSTLFYNIFLLFGEIIFNSKNKRFETIDLYIKNYFDNHPEALLNYNSKINLNNQINQNLIEIKKENKKSKNYKLTNSNNFNQSLTIKMNIKDMMTEKNFLNFEKDMKNLTNGHFINYKKNLKPKRLEITFRPKTTNE